MIWDRIFPLRWKAKRKNIEAENKLEEEKKQIVRPENKLIIWMELWSKLHIKYREREHFTNSKNNEKEIIDEDQHLLYHKLETFGWSCVVRLHFYQCASSLHACASK